MAPPPGPQLPARAVHPASDPSLNVRMVMWRATLKRSARGRSRRGAGAWESEIPLYQAEARGWKPTTCTTNSCSWSPSTAWSAGVPVAAVRLSAAGGVAQLAGCGAEAEAERPWRAVFLCSLLALWWSATSAFRRMAATGALFAVCLGGLAGSDARLGFAGGCARALPVAADRPCGARRGVRLLRARGAHHPAGSGERTQAGAGRADGADDLGLRRTRPPASTRPSARCWSWCARASR